MQIHNAVITGSFSYNGADLSNVTSSNAYSASLSTRVSQIEQVYATTGSNSFRATQSITGSLTVTGQIIAQTLNVQQVTSSIVFSSGSNNFGCDLNSRQTFTGSVLITGSLIVNTTGPELQVTNAGVILGNLLTDNHSITGSLRISGSGNHSIMGGNVGIGTTPSAWGTVFTRSAIQFGGSIGVGVLWTNSFNNGVFLGNNLYDDGAGNARYILNGTSTQYVQAGGEHYWVNAVSGTAGNVATFIERMRITSGGNVGIGTSTPSSSLDVTGTGRFTGPLTINGLSPITASGGTVTTPGDGFKYHTFTSSGTFIVTAGLNNIEVAVVAGGGAGGGDFSGLTFYSGGGGAGGVVYHPSYLVTSGSYTVTIGAGGTPNALSNGWGGNGANSVFGNITAIGGGGGARGNGDNTSPVYTGLSGGSGGGGGSNGGVGGNPLTPLANGTSYGCKGFTSSGIAGGGGGATSGGATVSGPGGNGIHLFTTGSKYAGGGGAGVFSGNPTANAGTDGGGNGGYWNGSNSDNSGGLPGTANRGGGGGGIGYNIGNGGAGGSGIVIVRYKA